MKTKTQIQEQFNRFLDKQDKETDYETSIKDAFTTMSGSWHGDYYEMLDFLYSLFGLPPDLSK